LALIVRIAVAGVLLLAAALKLRRREAAATALATFGVPESSRVALVAGVSALEAGLAVALLLGAGWAPYAAGALFAAFAVLVAAALAAGRRGAPCGCFGASSRIGAAPLVRNAALAGICLALPSLPSGAPSTQGWLALALALAFVCIAALGVAVLALTREVGVLRLRLGPEAALDIAGEGPPLGSRVDVPLSDSGRLTLAIFSSEGCRVCQTLAPVIDAFRAGALLDVEVFDEVRDADVWQRLDIPGSPYAVAVDGEGEVRAKGTFNTYGQLEGIVATAERALAL
jgi:hypothetical protein